MSQAVASSVRIGAGGRYQVREILPMVEMNTTPLIDVMLVLLIMFIITVPTQTHQVGVNLPPPTGIVVHRLSNDLTMSPAGLLRWNGAPITDAELAGTLAGIAELPEPPEVHFKPDAAARYARVDQVLAIAARSELKTFGFIGNERYRNAI